MNDIINCISCGGNNQIPEGKSTMFCLYCGNLIEIKKEAKSIVEQPIKSKPKIQFLPKNYTAGYNLGELILKGQKITSLNQVTKWFTDYDLAEIGVLDLSDNMIDDLSGIEKFPNLLYLNLNNNNLKIIDFNNAELPDLSKLFLENNPIKEIISFPKVNRKRESLGDFYLYVTSVNEGITRNSKYYLDYYLHHIEIYIGDVDNIKVSSAQAFKSLESFFKTENSRIKFYFNGDSFSFFESLNIYYNNINSNREGSVMISTGVSLDNLKWTNKRKDKVNVYSIYFGPLKKCKKCEDLDFQKSIEKNNGLCTDCIIEKKYKKTKEKLPVNTLGIYVFSIVLILLGIIILTYSENLTYFGILAILGGSIRLFMTLLKYDID